MKKALIGIVGLAVLAGSVQAQTFVTPINSTSAGNPVNAKAVFTINANLGTVTVNLFNLLTASQVQSVGGNLSNIAFTLSGTGFTNASISNTSPFQNQLVNVASGGGVTLMGTTNQLGWGLLGSNGSYTIEDLGFAGPSRTLIGGTAGSTTPYTNANGSIAGNGPHQSFIQGEADWVINVSGLTANTVVTSATFSFGTTLGNDVVGIVPEPATLAALGLGAIGLIRRRAKR